MAQERKKKRGGGGAGGERSSSNTAGNLTRILKKKNFLQRIEKSDANMGRLIGEEKKNYTQAER